MSSKREEDRNEKIIRGLMKLPPNRRCINCNSLVPQYVCTNFWTFVCTTCSGIHREFTHRVKSVSMAKFTTQELEALQNGGNQRAKEIYLKEWDTQNLRLPDNSKPDKIREFIKNVYINKKYIGGKSSENASKDVNLSSHEDEIRRASSYHSYSQSPPYDFQYEERRYGKRTLGLSRKPGSDRGLYEKNFSSFLSPSRLIDRVNEDRFGIERSNSRASDCSMSSGGETSRDFSSEDLNQLRNSTLDLFSITDGEKMSHAQRTVSFPRSYSVSNDSTCSVNISSESVQTVDAQPSLPALSQSSPPMNFDGLDLFNLPFAPQNVTYADPVISTSKQPIDLFQPFTSNNVAQSEPPNEGWATFDLAQKPISVENSLTVTIPCDNNSLGNFDPNQWPSFPDNTPQIIEEAVPNIATTQLWNAFEDSDGHLQIENAYRSSKEASSEYENESISGATMASHSNMALPDFGGIPVEAHSFTFNNVSTNPFDVPYDPPVGYDDMSNIWDMSSLQDSLPNGQMMPTSFTAATNQPWFSDDPIGPFSPPGSEGTLEFIAGQVSNTQSMNGPTHEPVVSVGGNPFA